MNVVTSLSQPQLAGSYARPQAAGTSSSGSPDPVDQAQISRENKRKSWKALAWAGFGVQCVGAALTLTGGGWTGVAIFAAGSAMIVGGEYQARRS